MALYFVRSLFDKSKHSGHSGVIETTAPIISAEDYTTVIYQYTDYIKKQTDGKVSTLRIIAFNRID
jgi:hypothetical protein